jgi:hypothetical protein
MQPIGLWGFAAKILPGGFRMARFEYDITKHPAETFKQLVYFCSESGECKFQELPSDQLGTLKDVLNKRGAQGWELIQLSFGTDGLVAFWKRSM